MFLKIYAICWLILSILGLGVTGAQLANTSVDRNKVLGTLIGVLVSIPIYVCAFLYIFK